MKILRLLALPLLLAAPFARAAAPAFYFVSIDDKDNALLFSDAQRAPIGALPYVLIDRADKRCCFKAGIRPGAKKPVRKNEGDGHAGGLMSGEDKPILKQVGHIDSPAKTEADFAYGIEGMQSVTRKRPDTYQITLQAGSAPIFVHTCYSGEGLRLQLFRRLADKTPYASYYYYLGYDVEPTCR